MKIHWEMCALAIIYFVLLVAPHKEKVNGKYPPKLTLLDYTIAVACSTLVLFKFLLFASIIFFAQLLWLISRCSYHNPHSKND